MALQLRKREDTKWDLVSLGEILLRFDPGDRRVARTRSFQVWEGGGEYNVARGIRRCFGLRSSVVTALVDNPLGRLVEDLVLEGGVDTSNILWRSFDGVGQSARNGIYFLERGFGIRAARGMMDRGHTAVSQLTQGQVDWDAVFRQQGTRWFHTGGIMCALSETTTAVVVEAMEAAKRNGVVVSYDCNYRPSLWQSRGGRMGACAVNRRLAPYVDVLLGHSGDLAKELCAATGELPWHDADSFGASTQDMVAEFPNLQIVAATMRRVHTATSNDWGAFAWSEGKVVQSRFFHRLEILDRVGGGDAFASGLFYGLLSGKDLGWSLNCGVAHGALTMTTPGDSSMVSLAEVVQTMESNQYGVQR